MIKIYTDSCSDIPNGDKIENLEVLPYHYYFEGENIEYGEDIQLNMKDFFMKIKKGKIPHTSSVNPEYALEKLLRDVLLGNDIVCICTSSNLSSTYYNVLLAKHEIEQDFPDANIAVIDSLTGSLAEGLLTLKAVSLREEGKNFDEIVNYLETYKKYYQINFFVNDLEFLKKGGRISKTACTLGTTLGIKPLIHVNNDGFAEHFLNCRGIQKCDNILLEKLKNDADINDPIGIIHSDDILSAKRLKEKIEQLNLAKTIILGEISPTIASHVGPKAYGLTYKMKQNVK